MEPRLQSLIEQRRGEQGFALIIAMFSLLALTILGATAVTMTNLDLRLAQNLRRGHQVFWTGQMALDRARFEMSQVSTQHFDDMMQRFVSAAPCYEDWHNDNPVGANAPDVIATGSYNLGNYVLQLCYRVCAKSITGYELSADRSFDAVFLDFMVEAYDEDQTGAARSDVISRQGGLIRMVGQDICGY